MEGFQISQTAKLTDFKQVIPFQYLQNSWETVMKMK